MGEKVREMVRKEEGEKGTGKREREREREREAGLK